MQIKDIRNYSYSAYSSILNAVKLLFHKYEYFYYINGDTLIADKDVTRLYELKQLAINNNRKCAFFKEFDGMVDAKIFWSNMKFFINEIAIVDSKEKFIEYTKTFTNPYVPNVLESFFSERIDNGLKNHTLIINQKLDYYFSNSEIDILNSFNGTATIRKDYQVSLLKEKDSNRIFFVYINNNEKFEEKTISIKINEEAFSINNGYYSLYKEVFTNTNLISLQLEDTYKEYSVKDILQNTESYIQFK
jgi:hypothetical protein